MSHVLWHLRGPWIVTYCGICVVHGLLPCVKYPSAQPKIIPEHKSSPPDGCPLLLINVAVCAATAGIAEEAATKANGPKMGNKLFNCAVANALLS
jgi:hypothetical protein